MNETIARAGERAGAAQAVMAERAGQAQEALAEHWDSAREALAEGWGVAQDKFAERLTEARHELAARIEPERPGHRRDASRWMWLVLLLGLIAGVAGAVLLTRRPREIEPEPFVPSLAREPGSRGSDPGRDPGNQASNGVVGAEVPSAGTE